ncbi:hypothetical protein A1704_12260 [Chryseobacterium cucumeris]|uniref:hypothetical protein n=1 Tax=Chryseobacterium cucumeris TaxID=1813611 RepID=UPI0007874B2C|nr:hypothetical protein [Chryseobacterium cucumeris]KYH05860.1 hypothetical protein A1704_12260 [Chryseobacterium cucumeris]
MIEIQDIKTNNNNDIVNLLLDEEQPFDIYFPKYTILFSSTNEDIAYDYARLAYVGYKLNLLSDNINYDVVHPHDHSSISFEITTKNIDSLASLLLELSYLYENDDESDLEYNFWDDVFQYIYEVENNISPPTCPEFIEIYHEFVNKNTQED